MYEFGLLKYVTDNCSNCFNDKWYAIQTHTNVLDKSYEACLSSSLIISASLSISIASCALMVQNFRLDHLSVGLSVRKVYCGKRLIGSGCRSV